MLEIGLGRWGVKGRGWENSFSSRFFDGFVDLGWLVKFWLVTRSVVGIYFWVKRVCKLSSWINIVCNEILIALVVLGRYFIVLLRERREVDSFKIKSIIIKEK